MESCFFVTDNITQAGAEPRGIRSMNPEGCRLLDEDSELFQTREQQDNQLKGWHWLLAKNKHNNFHSKHDMCIMIKNTQNNT